MMKKATIKLQYNSPVVLSFALVALGVPWFDIFIGGRSTYALFSVYRSSFSDPGTYPRFFLEATIQSMLPSLWGEYNSIVQNYKAERWGIYDDSADLNRAIMISDAYYGDRSSVLQLYRKTEKPIMIQSVNVR